MSIDKQFDTWVSRAEERYLADLTRAELGRALRALSSCYVERRGRLAQGAPLATAGKRAAFALFYAPLHFLTVRHIAEAIGKSSASPSGGPVTDLGCGTGAAGAAWALVRGTAVRGYDVNAWAVREADWTYRTLGVNGSAHRTPLDQVRLPRPPATILAAYLANELPEPSRGLLMRRLLESAEAGCEVVVVEPIARALTPWWAGWQRAVEEAGGTYDEWRFAVELPPLLRDLDRAAGLDHRQLTAKTLRLARQS